MVTRAELHSFWSIPEEKIFATLGSSRLGLSSEAAASICKAVGPNIIKDEERHTRFKILWNQIKSPIVILLASAALLSSLVGDPLDGTIIFGILVCSSLLSYWQEARAHDAVKALLQQILSKSTVLRNNEWQSIPSTELVPGDIISLIAGSQIPVDARLLDATDLSVDESTLTGESFPADKKVGECGADSPLKDRWNSLFMGSHVLSGKATAIVVLTGKATTYGHLVAELRKAPPPTEFELGVRHFGYFLLEVALVLSLVVLAINISYERPALESLLFTLALVVGMTPQLLTAIVTTTLAQGAHRMAQKQTIVRRLNSIADLGGISVLCTDKTGTLTQGVVTWEAATSIDGTVSPKARLFGYLNALHESGFSNVIDDAIRASPVDGATEYTKLDEVPYDFGRKMLSILVQSSSQPVMITKGALREIVNISTLAELPSGVQVPIDQARTAIEERFHAFSREGKRCLGLAYRPLPHGALLSRDSEREMIFLGILIFSDPPKPTAVKSMKELEDFGITCKLITGDNRYVAAQVASALGVLEPDRLMTGEEIDRLSDGALRLQVRATDIFAEVDPNQKERIILAFKKLRIGVGYLGDGINDAAALHAADVGISVDTAVDITKEAADVVLLTKDLEVLVDAIREGRAAFANTLKYILLTTSANFGNMFSVAGAAFFADFLPMLPKQILLLNMLSDIPAMALSTDRVDEETVSRPLRWSARQIAIYMLIFGLISSVFDYLTFGTLLILHVPAPLFRTSWFIESVLSEVFILLVIRTSRPLWKSPVGGILGAISVLVVVVTLLLPYGGIASKLGFAPPPPTCLLIIAAILLGYVGASEVAKKALRSRSNAR